MRSLRAKSNKKTRVRNGLPCTIMNRFIFSHDLSTMTKQFTTHDDGSFARRRTIGWDPAAIRLIPDCNGAFPNRTASSLRLHTSQWHDLYAIFGRSICTPIHESTDGSELNRCIPASSY